MVFVNQIYDLVVDTQFRKFYGRRFARSIFIPHERHILRVGRWLPWVLRMYHLGQQRSTGFLERRVTGPSLGRWLVNLWLIQTKPWNTLSPWNGGTFRFRPDTRVDVTNKRSHFLATLESFSFLLDSGLTPWEDQLFLQKAQFWKVVKYELGTQYACPAHDAIWWGITAVPYVVCWAVGKSWPNRIRSTLSVKLCVLGAINRQNVNLWHLSKLSLVNQVCIYHLH